MTPSPRHSSIPRRWGGPLLVLLALAVLLPDIGAHAEILEPSPYRHVLVGAVDDLSYFRIIWEMSGYASFWFEGGLHRIHTRMYPSPERILIARHLGQKLEDYGYSVSYDTIPGQSALALNVVATRIGTVHPDEYVVLGAHYDSLDYQGDPAPGAEDNASGVAAFMELARVASEVEFERSVQFVLFDMEESGLVGARRFVQEVEDEPRNVVAMLSADMICYYESPPTLWVAGREESEWLLEPLARNVDHYSTLVPLRREGTATDAIAFMQAGIPAAVVLSASLLDYPYIHSSDDTWAAVSGTAHLGVEVTRALAATAADLVGIASSPVPVDPRNSPLRPRLTATPNPFNPRTRIRFELPVSGTASLVIYDLRGRCVAHLVHRSFEEGVHEVDWDGTDDRRRPLGSGVYLCHLQGPAGETSMSLTLVR